MNLLPQEPRQCEAATAAARVKRSILNDDQKVETGSSEAEISLRVILPLSGETLNKTCP